MNVTTLPASRQRKAPGAARSGGRSALRTGEDMAYGVAGAAALQPEPRPDTSPGRRGTARPEEQHAPPRLRVAPPAPVTAPRAPFVALVLVLVIAGVVGILVLNTKIAENSFRLHDLRTEQGALDQKQQRLERELARKESPGELAAAAIRNGLVPAGELAFIVLPDGREVGMPGPGTPVKTG